MIGIDHVGGTQEVGTFFVRKQDGFADGPADGVGLAGVDGDGEFVEAALEGGDAVAGAAVAGDDVGIAGAAMVDGGAPAAETILGDGGGAEAAEAGAVGHAAVDEGFAEELDGGNGGECGGEESEGEEGGHWRTIPVEV